MLVGVGGCGWVCSVLRRKGNDVTRSVHRCEAWLCGVWCVVYAVSGFALSLCCCVTGAAGGEDIIGHGRPHVVKRDTRDYVQRTTSNFLKWGSGEPDPADGEPAGANHAFI